MKEYENIAGACSIIFVTTLLLFAGCSGYKSENSKDIGRVWTNHGMNLCTKVVEIEGHKYILMDGARCSTMIHAESCPCKKGF